MDDPLGSTDDLTSLLVGYLKPVAVWRGSMPGPLSRGALGDVGAFESLPEAVEWFAVSFVLNNNHVGELFFREDLGQLEGQLGKVVQGYAE